MKLLSLGATVLLTIAWGSWQRFCQYRRRMFANLNIQIVTLGVTDLTGVLRLLRAVSPEYIG